MVQKAKVAPKAEVVAAEAPVAEVVLTAGKLAGADVPAGLAGLKYTLEGGAAYNPRVTHTQEAWAKLQKAFGGKSIATHKQLADALSVHFTRTKENHHDFIGYMVRRGAIHKVA